MLSAPFWPPFRIRIGLNGEGGGITPEPEPEPGDGPIRGATPVSALVNYNGHSLIDTATWNQNEDGYEWMHAVYEDLLGDMLAPASPQGITRMSIAGSSTQWRWDHWEEGSSHGSNVAEDFTARGDIDQIDLLVLAEGGPHWITRISDGVEDPLREGFANIIAGQRNWIDLAETEGSGGDGAEVIYYQIWPALDGWEGESYVDRTWTFEQWVEEYDRVAKFKADYWSHHLGRQVFVYPGHRLYGQMKIDIDMGMVPGVDDIADLYPEGDTIHPYKAGAWPARLMLAAMIYKVNPTDMEIALPPYITAPYHDYCCRLAWDVLQDYALAGFGGSDWGAGDGYVPGVTPDPLNPPDPVEPEPGDLPTFTLAATPQGYTGPVLSVPPSWTDGVWTPDRTQTTVFDRDPGATPAIAGVAVIRLPVVPDPAIQNLVVVHHNNPTFWMGQVFGLQYSGYHQGGIWQVEDNVSASGLFNIGPANTEWAVVWWYNDGSTLAGGVGSATPLSGEAATIPAMGYLSIGGIPDDSGASGFAELRGLWIWQSSSADIEAEMAAVRALAATYMPG